MLDTLHKTIIQMEWDEVNAILSEENGPQMAKNYFKEDLPLHMAVERKAPDHTILALLSAFPDAAALAGRLGGTPLHLAAQQKLSTRVLVALIRACPEVLDQEDDSRHLPQDYIQRNEMSREALSRPSACWIEDAEKEDYNEKIQHRTEQLRQKIQTLKIALDVSTERRDTLKEYVKGIEPRLKAQRDVLSKISGLDNKMKALRVSNQDELETLRARIKTLSDEISKEPEDEETMVKSLMKRKYMEGVQRKYEKLNGKMDQIRKDVKSLRFLAERKHQTTGNVVAMKNHDKTGKV